MTTLSLVQQYIINQIHHCPMLQGYINPAPGLVFLAQTINTKPLSSRLKSPEMASSNYCFVLAVLMALSFSSMINVSLAARGLLQLPPLPPMPTFPATLPPLPSIPNLPQPTIPSLPQPSLPTPGTLPTLPTIPNIPTTIPSIPFFSPPPAKTSP
ncbi:hypothetical protein PTKIN_Ptkin09bG0216700 [Pterospermum kingtungense]